MAQPFSWPCEVSPKLRGSFAGVVLFSGAINLLTLTGSVFMLQVYDRVIPSRSVPTLVGLALLAAGLYAFQGLLDLIRGRMLVRIGASLHESLSERVFEVIVRLPLLRRSRDGLSFRWLSECSDRSRSETPDTTFREPSP